MKCYKNSNLPYPEAFWDIFYQGVGLKEHLMSSYCVIFHNFLNKNAWQRPTAQLGMQRSWVGREPRGVNPTSNLKCSSDVSAKFIWQLGQISTVFKTRFDHICHNKKILSSTYCPWVPWWEEAVYKPSELEPIQLLAPVFPLVLAHFEEHLILCLVERLVFFVGVEHSAWTLRREMLKEHSKLEWLS